MEVTVESERQRKIVGIRRRNVEREDRRVETERRYSLFGWSYEETSHVAEDVTVEEAKEFAEERNLRGYHLGPVDYAERGAHAISYVRNAEGRYEVVPMWKWLEDNYNFAEIYPPGRDESSLVEEP
jgi:hypothetical protein